MPPAQDPHHGTASTDVCECLPISTPCGSRPSPISSSERFAEAEALCVAADPACARPADGLRHAVADLPRRRADPRSHASTPSRPASAPCMRRRGDILEIATSLIEVGEHHLAYAMLGLVDPEHPANAGLLLDLGRLYSTLEDQPQRAALHRAGARQRLRRARSSPTCRASCTASSARSTPRSPRARKASPRRPHYGHAHWSCAQFGRKEGARERIARMREALQHPGLDNDDITYLHYGLFKELDTLGETRRGVGVADGRRAGAAQRHRARRRAGNGRLRRADRGHVGRASSTSAATCRAMPRRSSWSACRAPAPRCSSASWATTRRSRPAASSTISASRCSGSTTSACRSTLDAGHRRVRRAPGCRRCSAAATWPRPPGAPRAAAFYVDKHPMNFQWCGAILKALPHAKIIHLRRHPMDSCFSNLKELFAHKYYPYSYALDELATHYRNYARLMRHWHAIAPGRILDVRYEDLVSQPDVEAQARAGLPGPAGSRGRHRHPRQQDGHHDRQHAAAAPADPHPQRRRLAPLRGRHGAGGSQLRT